MIVELPRPVPCNRDEIAAHLRRVLADVEAGVVVGLATVVLFDPSRGRCVGSFYDAGGELFAFLGAASHLVRRIERAIEAQE